MPRLSRWTIARAEGAGTVTGLSALILWPAYAAWAALLPLFVLALALCAGGGLSLLAITLLDLARHRRRSARLVPIRVFDLVFGLALAAPSLIALRSLVPDLLPVAGAS